MFKKGIRDRYYFYDIPKIKLGSTHLGEHLWPLVMVVYSELVPVVVLLVVVLVEDNLDFADPVSLALGWLFKRDLTANKFLSSTFFNQNALNKLKNKMIPQFSKRLNACAR